MGSANHPNFYDHAKAKVDVTVDYAIAISLPGTGYRVQYRLSPDEPRLIQSANLAVDKQAPMSHKDFEAIAWEAATHKARELGWIL
jgi:hypothetical protein